LVALGVATGLFTVDEADLLLRGVLDDLHDGRLGVDHCVVVWCDKKSTQPAGWAYFAPNEKADRV
jgi:hypothetical protein